MRWLEHKASRAAINFNSSGISNGKSQTAENVNGKIQKWILQSHCRKCQLQILTKAVEQMCFLFRQISLIWTSLINQKKKQGPPDPLGDPERPKMSQINILQSSGDTIQSSDDKKSVLGGSNFFFFSFFYLE